ncbi:hypothetical protein TeGR_g8920 [Tetraparma gracilis]|uniref:Nudix hydrolase domain-containing protein n=1 Tax=Tetraparma gracilis TaxID=2962635 RepID=A0ABQ6NB28_9STRA|nr:hypothetical protein TeGR_g8920 [Tetraparma gracilis]
MSLTRTLTRLPVTHPRSSALAVTAVASFFLGSFLTTQLFLLARRSRRLSDRDNAGASREQQDLSLFYGDERQLTRIERNNSHLPDAFYGEYVHNCIVSCVDLVIVRQLYTGAKQCLLVERKDEPAKGKWWFPGGRQFKGETFFKAAERKCVSETGLKGVATQVLGVWNTFFDTSAWDIKGINGTQTVNVAVYLEVPDNSEVILDSTSGRFRWIDVDPEENSDEDEYTLAVLRRIKAYAGTFSR